MVLASAARWLTLLAFGSLHDARIQAAGDGGAPPPVVAAEALPGPASEAPAPVELPDLGLLLQAGRTVPPGLTATRARDREKEKATALASLAERCGPSSPERDAWLAALRSRLSDAARDVEVWVSCARVAGELGLYQLVPDLTAALADGAPVLAHEAACDALQRLYGQRPARGAAFAPPFEPGPGTAYLLERLRESDARAREARIALVSGSPEVALGALADPVPQVRSAAARTVAEAVQKERLDAVAVRTALRDRLRVETYPGPFHAALEGLLALSAGLPPDDPFVLSLRDDLLALARDPSPAFYMSLARGLARMPWERGTRTEGTLRAAQRDIASLLGKALDSPHGDADVIAGVLASLQDLLSRVQLEGEDAATWVRGCDARGPLMRIVRAQQLSEGLRTSAAGVLKDVALPQDAGDLLTELARERTGPGLRYALLGSLAPLAETYPETAPRVVDRLFLYLDDPDADLRRRALTLLSSPKLEGSMRGRDLSRLVDRLESEPVAELKNGLLDLVRRYGDGRLLEPFLAHASFDNLASGDPAGLARLGEALRQLTADDPAARVRSARRLASVTDGDTELARLTQCLELVASLTAEQARALPAEDHARIVRWALRLRFDGVLLSQAVRGGDAFLRRLVDVHLPSLPEKGSIPRAERLHARALFLGDLAALGDEQLRGEVLASYERALVQAEEAHEPGRAALVRRDRARFARANGQPARALEDLRKLAADPAAADVIQLADLRVLAELCGSGIGVADPRAAALEATDALQRLVGRSEWPKEPGTVRLGDLRRLVERAVAARDPARLAAVAALFDRMPTEVGPEPEVPPGGSAAGASAAGPVAVWSGLVREPEWLAELRALRETVRQALAPAGAPKEPAPEAPAPPPAGNGAANRPRGA